MAYGEEFQEIAHCGGQVIVKVAIDEKGHRKIGLEVRHSTPKPAAWFAAYVLPQGIPVGTVQLGGIGQPWNPMPHWSCVTVFIASDSHGLFGHECPDCARYWRSKAVPALWPLTCPYCGLQADTHEFLTQGQRRFAVAFCELTGQALQAEKASELMIDMDKVADDVQKGSPRPSFYYTEESQQNHYTCAACGGADDILGTYGYCSCCGTRNDLQELTRIIESIRQKTRERITTKEPLASAVPDAVGAFDSVARQYAKQLAERVPMAPARRSVLESALFHNLTLRGDQLEAWFGIDLFHGLDAEDRAFISRMFYRRHVYEHNGGEVDARYLEESRDTSVKLKQALHETPETVFRMAGLVLRMARNLHTGFHELFPPVARPIELHQEQQARLKAYR